MIIEQWRKHYNIKSSHSALGYRPPAPDFNADGRKAGHELTMLLDHSMGAGQSRLGSHTMHEPLRSCYLCGKVISVASTITITLVSCRF